MFRFTLALLVPSAILLLSGCEAKTISLIDGEARYAGTERPETARRVPTRAMDFYLDPARLPANYTGCQ